jgi:hypothetical protein
MKAEEGAVISLFFRNEPTLSSRLYPLLLPCSRPRAHLVLLRTRRVLQIRPFAFPAFPARSAKARRSHTRQGRAGQAITAMV